MLCLVLYSSINTVSMKNQHILWYFKIFTENQRITKLVCHVILLGEAGEEALNDLLSCHTSPPMTSTAPPISKKLHPNNKRNTPEQNTPPLMNPTTDQKIFYEYVCVESYSNQYRKSKSIFSFAEPAITLSHL